MNLAVNPPVLPMLSKRIAELPAAGDWIFEPKWDGFRALIFRDGDEILIQSRDAKPLNRYFPELLDPIRAQLPEQCVLDAEIVIAHGGRLDFDGCIRLHRACSFWPRRVPRRSFFSTYYAWASATCGAQRSRSGGGSWERCSRPHTRPST
jgi:ATP dependent DNA ligase domain